MKIPTDEEIRIAVATLVSNYLRSEDYAYPHERERQEMTARFTKVYHAALKQLKPLLTLVEQVREARKAYEEERRHETEAEFSARSISFRETKSDKLAEILNALRDKLELGE